MDGIDMLLQVIAHYKKRTPTGPEEEECVENLFNALCTVLMVAENQTRFRHSEVSAATRHTSGSRLCTNNEG